MAKGSGPAFGDGAVQRRGERGAAAILAIPIVALFILFIVVLIDSNDTESEVEAVKRPAAGLNPQGSGNPDPSGGVTTTAPPSGTSGSTASVLTAGSRSLLPVPSRDELASLVGQAVTGRAAPVESVVANEGFWVGTSASDRIFVFLTPAARGTSGESPFTVQPGQKVELSGTLKALSGQPSSLGLDEAEGASQLGDQGHYVEATSVSLSA